MKVCLAICLALGFLQQPQTTLERLYRPGERFVLKGQMLYVEKATEGRLTLIPPEPITASIGAFIAPTTATASSSQEAAGRSPSKLIDGSGWGETWHGSGVFVHTNNVFEGGSSMWNAAGADPVGWVQFDLGASFSLAGVYLWNYNEGQGYANRSVKELEILISQDGKQFESLGSFTLAQAPGKEADRGETVKFKAPVSARFVKFSIKSNHKGSDVSGLAEVRFANAAVKYTPPAPWKPTYPRPTYPPRPETKTGVVFPSDMGIVDLSKPPYSLKGDGITDCTAALQRALNDYPKRGAILYLPEGVYLVSDTLRWSNGGGDDNEIKNTVLQGQSRTGTVLKLRDSCPRFENPRTPRGVLWTGRAPAQRFGNEIRNLTVDTGVDNPGACGMQFMANNQGGVFDVTIVSGDGQGSIGLDMAYTDEEGPLLVQNVKVVGFDVGIATATTLASETLEHIELEHQNICGLRNTGQVVSIRDLRSVNTVPAVIHSAGLLTLLDVYCTTPTGKASSATAIVNEGGMLLRNLSVKGYAHTFSDQASGKKISDPHVAEFRTPAPQTLLKTAMGTLQLPVQETPKIPWDAPASWVAPQKFGAKTDDGQDDSEALQKAIDSGASTVYLPLGTYHLGKTVVLRGKVQRIIGGKANLVPLPSLKNQDAPLFRFENGTAPAVVIERLTTDFSDGAFHFLQNAATRTLVLRNLMINFQGPPAYRNTEAGTGDVFIEDVVGQAFFFKKQRVWARQFNPELNFHPGLHVLNDGGALWILGFKTEGGGTQIETRNGGKTEVLGGLIGDTNAGKLAPMFVNLDSEMSVTVAEVCFNNDPFDKLVRETLGGQTKLWKKDEPLSGMRVVIYEGHALLTKLER